MIHDKVVVNNYCCNTDKINEKLDRLIAMSEDTNKALSDIDQETNNIAAMIEKGINDLENNVITVEQLREATQPRIERLRQIGNTSN